MVFKRDLGVDVDRRWQQYDGNLVLTDGVDNVRQAIYNRLTCYLDDMAYFYSSYGSRMKDYMGKINSPNTREHLASEIRLRLDEEPRITDVNVEVTPLQSDVLMINIDCVIGDTPFVGNFVLNAVSNTLDMVDGETTYIKLEVGKKAVPCKPIVEVRNVRIGDSVKVFCEVVTALGEGVPIGWVDFYINKWLYKSIEVNRGFADWTLEVPELPIGTYTLTAHYRGLGTFGSSATLLEFKVVNKYDTETKFTKQLMYAIAGEYSTFPTTITDVNGGKVTDGDVVYSLQLGNGFQLDTTLNIIDMFKQYLNPKAVFHKATLYDSFGESLDGETIHFYIENADGILQATETLLSTSYSQEGSSTPLLNAKVKTEFGKKVPYGTMEWFLRKKGEGIGTTVTLPDIQEALTHQKNLLYGEVVDEEGYVVEEGNIDFYLRCMRWCLPYPSFTKLSNSSDTETGSALFNAEVVDVDGLKLNEGEVQFDVVDTRMLFDTDTHIEDSSTFSDNVALNGLVTYGDGEHVTSGEVAFDLSDMDIAFTTNYSTLRSGNVNNLSAMIVDSNGAVIDKGNIIQEDTSDGIISTYVSDNNNDEINSENTEIKFEITETQNG